MEETCFLKYVIFTRSKQLAYVKAQQKMLGNSFADSNYLWLSISHLETNLSNNELSLLLR